MKKASSAPWAGNWFRQAEHRRKFLRGQGCGHFRAASICAPGLPAPATASIRGSGLGPIADPAVAAGDPP